MTVAISYAFGERLELTIPVVDINSDPVDLLSGGFSTWMNFYKAGAKAARFGQGDGYFELLDGGKIRIEIPGSAISALTPGSYTYSIYVRHPSGHTEEVQAGAFTVASADPTVSYPAGAPAGSISEGALVHYHSTPTAAAVDNIHAAVVLADGAPTTVVAAITQPKAPCIIQIKGNQATVAGNVVVTGTDITGAALVATIASAGAAAVESAVVFATITSILFPARVAAADAISVGCTLKVGLPHVVANALLVLVNNFNNADDIGTVTLAVAVTGCYFTVAGALDGTKPLDLYYII